ncbi:MAG: hypothetical protein Q7S03_00295 [bacterium]|nr:hypothetical protein [bacterium]
MGEESKEKQPDARTDRSKNNHPAARTFAIAGTFLSTALADISCASRPDANAPVKDQDPYNLNLKQAPDYGITIIQGNAPETTQKPNAENSFTNPVEASKRPELQEQMVQKEAERIGKYLEEYRALLDLDEDDVHEFKEGKRNGFNSFELVGSPPLVVVIDGKCKLENTPKYNRQSNYISAKEAVSIIQRVDPQMLQTLSEYGVWAIASDIMPGGYLRNYPRYMSSFVKEGVIIVNEGDLSPRFTTLEWISILGSEGRAIHDLQYLENGLLPGNGQFLSTRLDEDKTRWFQGWVLTHKGQFNDQDAEKLQRIAQANVDAAKAEK